jgi:hypothetical protein
MVTPDGVLNGSEQQNAGPGRMFPDREKIREQFARPGVHPVGSPGYP